MYKIFVIIFLLIVQNNSLNADEEVDALDFECSNFFHIRQDDDLRLFHLFEDERSLGTVVSSGYGVLDFYDVYNEKMAVNKEGQLYDPLGQLLGSVQLDSDKKWIKRTDRMEIFSDKNELLATLDTEEEMKYFVFRDPANRKPFAIALWTPKYPVQCFLGFCHRVQNWTVMIVDRPYLQEKKIPIVFLVWALLKHSQKHLQGPSDLKYEEFPPLKPL